MISNAGGEAIAVQADVAVEEDVKRLVQSAVKRIWHARYYDK